RPISVQIIGSDPNSLKRTIEYLDSYEFDILDLNAGCPSKRAIKAHEGGYLMKDLEKLNILLNVMKKYSSRPISVKIRTGYSEPVDINKIVQIIERSEIDLLIIHARTVLSKFFNQKLDLDTVKTLKERLSIPIVGNGNIIEPKTAKFFIDFTNVDAFMVGRESIGNPEIFFQIHEYLVSKKLILFKNDKEKMRNHFRIYEETVED
ncbi:MAG: tRNA-dihydrouridine synthase family protein, partial [Promethearchaeota archaeon]